MKNKPVSFFFLGTACHRSTYQDVLTNFYDATIKSGTPARLFDGVGSHPEHLADEHPTPGRYVYDHENDKKIRANDKVLQGVRDMMTRLSGCLAGEGMDELLFEAILYLEKLIRENNGKMPETVNLHGYSRGADACLRLANLLDSMYPDVKVNLFLVDHVPGPGRRDDPSSYTIPKNVQNFESVIMLHEYKPGFDPQDRNRYVIASPQTTKVSIKVYPGWHGKAMSLTPDEKTNHVPRLLHDDIFRFEKKTGSLPEDAEIPNYKIMKTWTDYDEKPASVLSPEKRFQEYNGMQENWWFYSKGPALNTRAVLTNHRQYSQHHELFANQEHGELFQKLYPALYDWFLNSSSQKTTKTDVKEELEILAEEVPHFYDRFCKICSIKNGVIPEPRKVAPYYHPPLGSTLINDDLSFLKHSITSIINYTFHHRKENSWETRVAEGLLREALEKANSSDSKEAIKILQGAISNAAHFLHEEKPHCYMARQLKKLSITPTRFVDVVAKRLQTHIDNNRELHREQRQYLQQTREKLQLIKEDTSLSDFEKLRTAKSIVSSASSQLQMGTTENLSEAKEDSILAYNMLARGLSHKNSGPTLKQLITSLNRLNAPGFGQHSIAHEIANRFEAYYKRNLFWEGVNKILSTIMPVKLPPFVLPEKSALAKNIYADLRTLDETGQGNNLAEISKILTTGQKSLQAIYKDNKRLIKGEFDKIMEISQGQLQTEIDLFPMEESEASYSHKAS